MEAREKIVGSIVGGVGALMLAAGTASLAKVGARGVNIVLLILGVIWLAFGIRALQKNDRSHFFTLRGLAVFGFFVCACTSGYFLFKGEHWPYGSVTTSVGGQIYTSAYNDISAYAYYFTWSRVQRAGENTKEDAQERMMRNLVDSHGNSITVGSGGSLASKEAFNMTIAALGALGALSFVSLPFLRRRQAPITALEPTAAAPPVSDTAGNPKSGGGA